uniref:Uncharacterized protein n=1 Tax=Oryza glumipatula TaxID=40148 RepID=A0A0E0APB8_9ORYZ
MGLKQYGPKGLRWWVDTCNKRLNECHTTRAIGRGGKRKNNSPKEMAWNMEGGAQLDVCRLYVIAVTRPNRVVGAKVQEPEANKIDPGLVCLRAKGETGRARPSIPYIAAEVMTSGRTQAIIFMKLFLHGCLVTSNNDSHVAKACSINPNLTLNDATDTESADRDTAKA